MENQRRRWRSSPWPPSWRVAVVDISPADFSPVLLSDRASTRLLRFLARLLYIYEFSQVHGVVQPLRRSYGSTLSAAANLRIVRRCGSVSFFSMLSTVVGLIPASLASSRCDKNRSSLSCLSRLPICATSVCILSSIAPFCSVLVVTQLLYQYWTKLLQYWTKPANMWESDKERAPGATWRKTPRLYGTKEVSP